MKYIFWDIDGTLLLTGGAGIAAMADVIKDHFFLKDFQFTRSLAGRTDSEIIKEAVLQVKGKFRPSDAASLLIKYHMRLPQYLNKFQGSVMTNVQTNLEYFLANPNYTNCLLTGNTKTAAKLKLAHYNLDHYFNFDKSVFGEISENREELARVAWQRLYAENPDISTRDFIFVGDTPNDVSCAKAIDARSVIVLEGSHYTKEDFSAVNPWKILKTLPADPAELQKIFDEEE